MSIEKSSLRVTELDFDAIRENLKTYLRSQVEFQDFDFEGSGMSVLLDILAYNTHYMGYYLNMVGNEMFLDTAQLRNSIISHAKLMNYFPASRLGAVAQVNITVTPTQNEQQITNSITLDKYTRFLATDVNGVNYPFVTIYSNTAPKLGGSFKFNNITLKQGEVVTQQFIMDPFNDSRRFKLPSQNVDTSTISVTVQESTSNTFSTNYVISQDIVELTSNSTVFFVEEDENQEYVIYFGDGIIGKRPKDGNVISITYLDTVGEKSNNISRFTISDNVGGYRGNIIISTIGTSYGGAEREGIEDVRYRAPYYYNTQNRAVTKLDYQTLLLKDYPFIDSIAVWGGEENDPVVYGKVYISIKTKGDYTLTNFELERIKDDLIRNRNILTVIPEIVQPTYEYFNITGTVNYDSKLTSLTSGQLLERIKAAIADYNTNELNKFESIYRKSDLQQYIEAADPSIISSDIDLFLQKRIRINPTFTRAYNLDWNIPIHRLTNTKKISTFPAIRVSDFTGIEREIYIEETPSADTGIYSIEMLNGGFGYLTAPTVHIMGDGSGAAGIATVSAGSISKITITNPGVNYTSATVIITGGGGSGAVAVARLQGELNTLRSFYYKDTGEKVIINNRAGEVDYVNGRITIPETRIFGTVANEYYDENIWTITVPLEKDTVFPARNRIISIDENDPRAVIIEMVSES